MVYLFQNTMVFYYGLPVSKHDGILSWFTCFKTRWYFIMVYLFQNNMEYLVLPWHTLVYHGIPRYNFISGVHSTNNFITTLPPIFSTRDTYIFCRFSIFQ